MIHTRTTALAALVATLSFSVEPIMAAPATKPDNSAVNVRDRTLTEVTAQDQSTNADATETTRLIRAELTSDSDLSTYAKNVKIIVIGNLITLKGPVNSEAERGKILRTATSIAPGYKVQNELQVVR